MTRILLLTLILCCSIDLNAQDSISNDIVATRKFRYGIFESFSDFKANTLTVTSGFQVVYDSGEYVRATLRYENGTKVRRVYGFSDGVNVYINARIYTQMNYFLPVLELGPIVYFEDFLARQSAEADATFLPGVGFMGTRVARLIGNVIATDNPGWLIYLPDNEGYAYTLDKKTVASIFKNDDAELLEKFKNDTRPKDHAVLKEYTLEFNRRHISLRETNRR